MARNYSHGFNKEKLIFMLASLTLAGAGYFFFTTTPVPLEVGLPVSAQLAPTTLPPAPSDARPVVEYYVLDGKVTRMMDVRTGQAVNRQRKTPFAPDADYLIALQKRKEAKSNPGIVGKAPPPPPPPPPGPATDAQKKEDEEAQKTFDAKDRVAKVSFMGVIISDDGQTYGLLKPKDGSSPRRVKVGDKIEEYNYTVDRIEKQAIWVSDEDKTPFILKDSDEVADSDDGEKSDKGEKKAKKEKTAKKTSSGKTAGSSNGSSAGAGTQTAAANSAGASGASMPGGGNIPGLPPGMDLQQLKNMKDAMRNGGGSGMKSHPGRARK